MRTILILFVALLAVCASVYADPYGITTTLEASALRTASDTSSTFNVQYCDYVSFQFVTTLADLVVASGFIPDVQVSLDGSNWRTIASGDTLNVIGNRVLAVSKYDQTDETVVWGPYMRLILREESTADSNTTKVMLYRSCDQYVYP